MLGLTLAHRLAKRGCHVTLFEAAPGIGGLAAAWQVGDLAWDVHYHVTLLSDLRLRALLDDLGLADELRWVETKTGFYTDGRFYSMSNSWEFLRFPPLGFLDKIRLGATIMTASRRRQWRPLEQVRVADWLRKWSGRRTFEKIWQPLLLAKLGPSYERTSAVFIWATIARMYGARQAGLKKEMFGYVRGGYARVLQRFAERLAELGVDVRTDSPVTDAAGDDSGVSITTPRGTERFDRVVLTTPAPHVLRACPQLSDDERRKHQGIEYLGVLCASVVLKRPFAGYYVTNITDLGFPFTAVIEMTALVDPAELAGRHLVYLPRYAAADDEAWGWSDEEIQTRFLAGLRRMYPNLTDDDVVAFRVSRAPHVMALPTLGYSTRLPQFATGVPHVYAVNSSHIVKGTLNVNEIITLADSALATIEMQGQLPAENPNELAYAH
ncbi:MAG: NAD(P)/FAD-dependent oxidoreductase [Pirellulales bacterium]|nr:NAD(P)/FAD-dependent oxidoreductase [Pirellulales bacterium]